MGGEGDVDRPAQFQQAGAFCILSWGEDDLSALAAVATAGIGCRNLRGTSEQLRSGLQIQGMKALVIVAGRVFRHGHKVDGAILSSLAVDHRSARDSDFR